MRFISCSLCNKPDVQLNHSLKIDGLYICSSCIESKFTEDQLKGRMIEKEIDPTICSSCTKDFDDRILNTIGGYPICEHCEIIIKEKTFPTWVKGFFIGVLVLVAFSFVWNWRFIQAYSVLKKTPQAINEQNYKLAGEEFKSAYDNVPEIKDLRMWASYYNGAYLLSIDKSTEALAEFNTCKDFIPKDYNIGNLITQAEIGSGFDSRNYKLFLSASKKNLDADTTIAMSWAGVASAYACLYATSKSDSIKNLYYKYLIKAISLRDTTKAFSQYLNRLDHRINTGEIITAEQFDLKYPSGWVNLNK
jgi:hypothetical protein